MKTPGPSPLLDASLIPVGSGSQKKTPAGKSANGRHFEAVMATTHEQRIERLHGCDAAETTLESTPFQLIEWTIGMGVVCQGEREIGRPKADQDKEDLPTSVVDVDDRVSLPSAHIMDAPQLTSWHSRFDKACSRDFPKLEVKGELNLSPHAGRTSALDAEHASATVSPSEMAGANAVAKFDATMLKRISDFGSSRAKLTRLERHLAPVSTRIVGLTSDVHEVVMRNISRDTPDINIAAPASHSTTKRRDGSIDLGESLEPRTANTRDARKSEIDPAPGPVATQVLEAIFGSMNSGDENSGAATTHQSRSAQVMAPDQSPLRVLTIKLSPELLGTVSVVLSAQGDALKIHIETEDAETAEHLETDRVSLVNRIAASGYNVNELSIASSQTQHVGTLEMTPDPSTPVSSQQATLSDTGTMDRGTRQFSGRQDGTRDGEKSPNNTIRTEMTSEFAGEPTLAHTQHYLGKRTFRSI